jgi:hypothetical protein
MLLYTLLLELLLLVLVPPEGHNESRRMAADVFEHAVSVEHDLT